MLTHSTKITQLAKKFKTPLIWGGIILAIWFLYYIVYLTPFSNNAFVVANIRPVASDVVEGYITDIYVKNGEYVKKGHPLFTVFKKPYEFAYQKSVADVAQAKAILKSREQKLLKTQNLLKAKKAIYDKLHFDYQRYRNAWQQDAISEITVKNTSKESLAVYAELQALKNELIIEHHQIVAQRKLIQSLIAVEKNAKVSLNETTVYAKNDGFVQNMFVALGTPVRLHEPVFSFIESDSLAIQANLNEVELSDVREGSKVTIIPRIYFGRKIYHGIVASGQWAANRQITYDRTQTQIVTNSAENWFLLPQRIPVTIKITDYDPIHYPLSIGESAYVVVH